LNKFEFLINISFQEKQEYEMIDGMEMEPSQRKLKPTKNG